MAPVSLGKTGFGIMGLYTVPSGGAVFSGSTMDWGRSLVDSRISQITRNVFDRFLANNFPAEPVSSSDTNYYFYDRFNCSNLDHPGVQYTPGVPEWYKGVPRHNYHKVLIPKPRLTYRPVPSSILRHLLKMLRPNGN